MKIILFLLLALPLWGASPVLYSSCTGSPSMGPAFYRGRIVAIVPMEWSKLKQGMMVARANRDAKGNIVSYVGHRLLCKDGQLWVTRGDNMLTNSNPDSVRLSPSNFAGIYCEPGSLKPL